MTHCCDTNVSPFARARKTFVADTNVVSGTQNVSDFVYKQMFPSLRSPRNVMGNNVSSFTRTFRKPRRQLQREGHQTKGLISKTMVVHVRMCYESLYISLPSSAKQQREMTKFCVYLRKRTKVANYLYFHLGFLERWRNILSLSKL